MGKHEAPPFRMVVEGGRLVPATAYDAERLDTYRRGTKVSVRFTEEKDRVLVRKWWAIIGKAVKECATPWKTRDEASEAIKLSLGIVNLSKTVGGDWMQYPKSLTELTDPELVDAVEGMAAIIQQITGVDPDDWKKEIADVGEEDPGSASPLPDPDGSVSDHDVLHPSDDVSDPATAPVETGAETQEQSERAPVSELSDEARNVLRNSMAECIDKFVKSATDPKLDARGRQDAVVFTKNVWKDELATRPDFVKVCTALANDIVLGKKTDAAARAEMERWLP
jgi:hypothetical protein